MTSIPKWVPSGTETASQYPFSEAAHHMNALREHLRQGVARIDAAVAENEDLPERAEALRLYGHRASMTLLMLDQLEEALMGLD